MTAQEVKRKLAAIFSADVKGYSRLLGEDELGTIRTLSAHKEVMANVIQQHRGLKSRFPLLIFNGSFGMEINKNHFAAISIGRLETNYQV